MVTAWRMRIWRTVLEIKRIEKDGQDPGAQRALYTVCRKLRSAKDPNKVNRDQCHRFVLYVDTSKNITGHSSMVMTRNWEASRSPCFILQDEKDERRAPKVSKEFLPSYPKPSEAQAA